MDGNFDTLSSMQTGGAPPPQAPPLPFTGPEWTPIPYPIRRKVTKKHIDYVKEHVPIMMKRSAEYMQRKRDLIEQCLNLQANRLSLSQWKPSCWTPQLAKFEEYITSYRQTLHRTNDNEEADWRSDFTIAVQPIIDTYRESFLQAIFTQDEYFKVSPGPRNALGSVEDNQFPTADKIQAKLISSCDDMLIRSNIDLGISDAVSVGTLIAKAVWHEETMLQAGFNQFNELEFRPQTIRHGTVFKPLDLTRVLVDPDAINDDCQSWRFIGDRTYVSWDEAKSRFGTKDRPGPYNMGYREFMQKWPDSGDAYYDRTDGFVKEDPDKDTLTKDQGQIQAWELHAKFFFPWEFESSECVITYLTDINTDDPSGGVLVRLQLQPVTQIGLRPYLCYQHIRQAGPLGMGAIEQNLDIIWMLSHVQNLIIDAVRFVSIPLVKTASGSSMAQGADKKPGGTTIWPGKFLYWDSDPNDVQPFWFQSDLGPAIQLWQMFKSELAERTAVSAPSRGAPAPKRQTASEVVTLAQQASQPLAAKLSLFRETVLNPFGKLAVGYLQQYVFEDQHLFIQGADGRPVPTVLTVDELRTGEYITKAVINIPDQMKISRAQIVMQVIPILQQVAPMLLMLENKNVKFSGLIEAMVKLLDIDEIANVLETVDEMTKQGILMTMAGGQPMPNQAPPGGPPPNQMPQNDMTGPAGGQDDINQIMLALQMAAQGNGPVPMGQQMGAT